MRRNAIVQHPGPPAAHRLGQHLAAARRPADARRHRARARTRRWPRSRRASRAPASRVEDIELVLVTHHHLDHSGLAATIAAPLRRRGSRRSIARPPTARDYDERTAADRRFSLALMRHHGVPDAGDRRQRGVLGLHPRHLGGLRHRRRLRDGDTIRAGGRDLRVVARPGPQHHRRAARRRARAASPSSATTCSAGISSNTEVYPAVGARRDAPAGAGRVPAEPAADRRDAARPAADRPRRRGHRARRPRPPALRRPRAPLRAHRRGARAAAARPRSRSPRTCGRRARSPSSRCSSSGRCSGTSTCCSTRARVARGGDRRRHATATAVAPRSRPSRRDRPTHEPQPTRRWPPCTSQLTPSPRAGARTPATSST